MQLHSDTHTIRLGLLAGTTDDQDADDDGYDRDGVMRMINGSRWLQLYYTFGEVYKRNLEIA